MKIYDKLVIRDNELLYQDEDNYGSIIYRKIIPQAKVNVILSQLHSSKYGGHLGEHKTIERIQERFYWPFYRAAAEKFIKECECCQKIKRGPRRIAPMKIIAPTKPAELYVLDAAGPLILTPRGNLFMQIITDHFTKKTKFNAVPDLKAKTTAKI